ncbi:hypothetical protein LguiB_007626 [Lonicera macranthoides]
MSMLRRISTIAKLTPYPSFILPYIVTKVQKATSNSQKKPLDDIGQICCGLKLEEFQQKKEEANEKKEKNKDDEEEEKDEETGVEGEEDEFDKKFDEFMSGEFRRRNQILLSSPELAAKLTVVLHVIATKGLRTAWRNVWQKFSLDVKDYACMSKREFESLITVSSELKTYADVLQNEEKENPKGGGKAGEKKEEEKKGKKIKMMRKNGKKRKRMRRKEKKRKRMEKKEDKQEG